MYSTVWARMEYARILLITVNLPEVADGQCTRMGNRIPRPKAVVCRERGNPSENDSLDGPSWFRSMTDGSVLDMPLMPRPLNG
jgi:hypothetical protein